MKEKRIEMLDSFRFLAIISVLLYHYSYRWTVPNYDKNLYPYGDFFGTTFKYGRLGVQFFYIISGFVISFTLENTSCISAFFKNRFIRLFPPMLLWSIVTYLVFVGFDDKMILPYAHSIKNFLPSLTFIKPEIWSLILKHDFDWLNGSYWSLWVEVQFYIISSILFFSNKEKFFRNILLATLLICSISYLTGHFANKASVLELSPGLYSGLATIQHFNALFNITDYIGFFTLGVIFHHIYKRHPIRPLSLPGICVLLIFLYQWYAGVSLPARILFLIMIMLFLLLIYKRQYLFFLANPLFRRIGVISYSVYLAHENIGMLLINKYGGYLGKYSPLSVLLALMLVILLAELSYRYVEEKTARLLKRLLFKPKKAAASIIPGTGFN